MSKNPFQSLFYMLAALAALGCFEPKSDYVFGVSDSPAWGGDAVTSGDGTPIICVGVKPPASAFGATPGPMIDTEAQSESEESLPAEPPKERKDDPVVECRGGNCEGEFPPDWQLTDFQPQSCGFGATYGLGAYKGQVTVAVLLASW